MTKTIGIIIFRKGRSRIVYLLLHHRGPYWNFPKGRKEPDETDELETAFRETQEETGIDQKFIEIIGGFRVGFRYSFVSRLKEDFGKRVTKQAIFFLGWCKTKKIIISHEHIGYGWFEYKEARQKLYYENGQRVLDRAHAFLLKNGGKGGKVDRKIL